MKKNLIILASFLSVSCASQSDVASSAQAVQTQKSKVVVANAKTIKPKMVTINSKMIPDLPNQNQKTAPKKILSPLEAIKVLDQDVEGYHLGQNLTAEQIKENEALKKEIIQGTFDIRELCKMSLNKHWNKIGQAKQNEFVGLMTSLLEKKAILSKEQLSGENKYYKINYNKEVIQKDKPNQAIVYTKMIIPKEKIDLNITYKMIKKNAEWKIFDVIVDESSLMLNYRNQFDRIITKNGYEDLVARMKKKLASQKKS